jgi:hypothetical protein
MIKEFLKDHSAQLIVLGIGLAISFVIAGGNMDDVVAKASRR